MVLFNNAFRPSDSLTSSNVLPKPLTRIPGLGYIVFPASEPHHNPSSFNAGPDPKALAHEIESGQDHDQSAEEQQSTVKDTLSEEVQRRRTLEAAEACKGEEDWVRSGGVLRDREGRRDLLRTQAIREELKLRELEAQITERWDNYEKRWSELSSRMRQGDNPSSDTYLRFYDIPWPVKTFGGVELTAEHLTVENVKDFLLEGLSVRGVKITKKDRIRTSLLRWHPDKLGNLLEQIHPEDIENVRRGLGIVIECLQKSNAQSL